MLRVDEAQAVVLQHSLPLSPQPVPLSDAFGLVLAENVTSDLDMPPYDKAMMDGYAVRCADLPEGRAALSIIEEVTAGRTPQLPLGQGQATRIMTGAPIPVGADAVIPVERTRLIEERRVQIEDRPPSPGTNVLYRGREMRSGDTVLTAGALLRPAEISLLATVGRAAVSAHPRPSVAILSTGDEVVDAPQLPGPGQIRNSNSPMLLAQTIRAGGRPRYLGIARDRRDSMQELIGEGLKADVLVLSGGVSAGKLDLVPDVLRELGVEAHFHKVEMKPGKPVLFGTRGSVLVFGLPGNPVSSLVCFELFVRLALRRLMGHAEAGPRMVPLPLAQDFAYRTERPTYYPARRVVVDVGWQVQPVPWFGSADLRALGGTDALVLFPAGDHQYRAGQVCPVLMCD
jgi:molybdopterin molybdotransferase